MDVIIIVRESLQFVIIFAAVVRKNLIEKKSAIKIKNFSFQSNMQLWESILQNTFCNETK